MNRGHFLPNNGCRQTNRGESRDNGECSDSGNTFYWSNPRILLLASLFHHFASYVRLVFCRLYPSRRAGVLPCLAGAGLPRVSALLSPKQRCTPFHILGIDINRTGC